MTALSTDCQAEFGDCPAIAPPRHPFLPGCEIVPPGFRQDASKASYTTTDALVGPLTWRISCRSPDVVAMQSAPCSAVCELRAVPRQQ